MEELIRLNVNEDRYNVSAKPKELLVDVLRDKLGLTGTKRSCDSGQCGACTVLIDGKPVRSCLTKAVQVQDKKIMTIEGVAKDGLLDPLQKSFVEHGAVQCGYCTPGMIMSAKGFLKKNPKPTTDQVKKALSGNICRCTGYVKIIEAVEAVVSGEYA